uniref:BTB domain-containing protein n=1 Tax=Rhizophagus irregularis (strain DAOM 181602 / DAOM 197198 / MUCL 43194) TaxID=747089 RepID=U9TCU8_RHIID
MKENYETKISFPKINSVGMKIILEYTYTGSIKIESLKKDNIIEAFYAADYFQLPDLQDFIMKTFKNTLEKNCDDNYSPELLSKLAEKILLTEDNILLNLLVEAVAIIPLNTIEFGRLSITGLKYLLSCTHEKEETPFAIPEYELLILEQIRQENPVQIENKIFVSHQKVAKELEPLVKLIDFRRIKDLNDNRGMPNYVYDESACDQNLLLRIMEQFVSAKVVLGNKGVFEWDVIIEKSCRSAAVGVCASKNFNYETLAGNQTTGWVLGSIGYCCNFGNYIENYCPLFGDGTKITVHLDMNKELALLQSMEKNIWKYQHGIIYHQSSIQ